MRRGVGIALLLFQALWLNVILPGHQRGMIVLPGSGRAIDASSSCCASRNSESHKQPAPANRTAHCAVCAFAAKMSVPVAIDLNLSPLMRLGMVSDRMPTTIASVDLLLAYHGRAPPAAA